LTDALARRRWLSLVVLCVGQLMIVLDATIVNVALPSIQTDLHVARADLTWVINGYLITFGGLLLLAGRLGDLLGRKRVFLAGVTLFTLASLLCGLSTSVGILIGARFLQGAGAAIVASMVLGILVTLFPSARERATAMGVYAFVASAGGAIGLLVGGVLTEALSWHWIFFVNLPIGIGAILLGALLIPKHRGIGIHHGVDVVGALLVTAAPTLLVYALVTGSSNGWTSARTIGGVAGAFGLAGLFVMVESRVRAPLVPLRIFASRSVAGGNVVRALFALGMFGSFFLGALYLQNMLGYSAIGTGLAYLPLNIPIGIFSLAITARLVRRFSAKAVLIPGLTFVGVGLALLSRVPPHGSYVADVLPAMLFLGSGAGLTFMPTLALTMADAGPGDSGLLSGVSNVSQQLGAAFGVALLGSISATRTHDLLTGGTPQAMALASGYHLGFFLASACLAVAVFIAVVVLPPAARPPRPVPAELPAVRRKAGRARAAVALLSLSAARVRRTADGRQQAGLRGSLGGDHRPRVDGPVGAAVVRHDESDDSGRVQDIVVDIR